MTAEAIETIPLTKDEHGVFRVGRARVTLDLVIRAFRRGATPEEIAESYTSLQLADIYQVMGYYLKHHGELDEYLERHAREERESFEAHKDEWSPVGLRDRLLARRKNQ